MKSIFDNNNSIQVNPAWEYNETDHKWTIDENDVIVHTELSEEIYSDFHKLDQYNLVLEEACEAYNKLTDQIISNNNILDNHKITVEHISLSNECLSIYKAQLGYDVTVNRSNESDMTNYERLVISNEGIIDFIKELIIKIKELFKKVWNFFKNLFIKILRWLGLWEDKLESMKSDLKTNLSNENYEYDTMQKLRIDFNKIYTKNQLNIKSETLSKIFNLFPYACLTLYKPNTFIELFELIDLKDIFRPVTIDLEKTLKLISNGEYSNLNSSRIMRNVKMHIDKFLKHDKLETMYITTLNKTIKYLEYNTDKKEISGYVEIELEDSLFTNPTNYLTKLESTISKDNIENMFKKVQDDFIPKLKEYEKNIQKLPIRLDRLISEIDKNTKKDIDNEILEQNKKNLQLIKKFGVNIPNDINSFMFDTVKNYIKILILIYNDIKYGTKQNYEDALNNLKQKFPSAKIHYLGFSKNNMYLDPGREFWTTIYAISAAIGGCAMPIKNSQGDKWFGANTDYTSLIFIDRDYNLGIGDRANFKDAPLALYKELLDEIIKEYKLDNLNTKLENIDFKDRSNIDQVGHMVSDELRKSHDGMLPHDMLQMAVASIVGILLIVNDYENANDLIPKNEHPINPNPISEKDLKFIYYHEAGHIIMRQNEQPDFLEVGQMSDIIKRYTEGWVELQADCYAMLMLNLTVYECAKLRCKIMPVVKPFIGKYITNLKKQINTVTPWTKLSKFKKLINNIKNRNYE